MAKVMKRLEDCFENEEERKYFQFLRSESEDEKLIRRIKQEAFENQTKYRCCTQNVVYALQRHLEIGNKDLFKATSALSGGMIGKGTHICGALVGGLTILGLVFGRADFLEPGSPREGGPSNFTRTREVGDELYQQFKETFGSVICQEIQKRHFGWCPYPIDHSDPYHEELYQSGEIFDILSTYASQVVMKAAELTARIILREWHKEKGS